MRINNKDFINNIIKISVVLAVIAALLMLSACGKTENSSKIFETLDELKDCNFAISDSNSSYENEIKKDLPNASFERYTNYFDTFIAVTNGNADAAFCFKYTFIGLKESYPGLKYVESDFQIPIVALFSSNSDELKEDFNKFIAESEKNGLLEKLAKKWMYEYDSLTDADIVDFGKLDDSGRKIKFAVCNENVPYEYLRCGKLTGFEPAVFYEFCKKRGYCPEIIETKFDAVIAGVASGKYDMSMGGYGYTEERSENSNFSEPFFMDRVVYAVNGDSNSMSVLNVIKDSFERTYIRQDRWKLFVEGMLITLLITVLSVAIGAAVGFALFLISQKGDRLKRMFYGTNNTLEALPVLVVLMIFFYVIFGSAEISGVAVSVIVFGLYFTFTFFALISNSVNNVPKEQIEAGLALGYSSRQTLFKVVLPQAMESFIPSIRSAIIATLKGTAIVGYVAVQDLTKAGDLIRSQTFEAFLPIITVAVMYFVLAKILIFILNRFLVTPEERKKMKKRGDR